MYWLSRALLSGFNDDFQGFLGLKFIHLTHIFSLEFTHLTWPRYGMTEFDTGCVSLGIYKFT